MMSLLRRRMMMQVQNQIPIDVNLMEHATDGANPSDVAKGYVNDAGKPAGYGDSYLTDFMPINTYNKFVIYTPEDASFYAGKLHYYDSSYNHIQFNRFVTGEEVVITDIPAKASYVRFTVTLEDWDSSYYKRIA